MDGAGAAATSVRKGKVDAGENRWVATESLRSALRRLQTTRASSPGWTRANAFLRIVWSARISTSSAKVRWWWPVVLGAAYVDERPAAARVRGVKMNGPYEYVPAIDWYLDKDKGGAFVFATDISPGPSIPPTRA